MIVRALASCLALASCAMHPEPAKLPVPVHDTHVDLSTGNLEMSSVDGSALHLAPGTKISLDTSAGPDEVTHVLLHAGHLQVSNIDHAHNDRMHVQVGAHTFTIDRGKAVISHANEGIHATLIEGRHLGAIGHAARASKPGHRLVPSAKGMQRKTLSPSELGEHARRTKAPNGAPKTPGAGRGPEGGAPRIQKLPRSVKPPPNPSGVRDAAPPRAAAPPPSSLRNFRPRVPSRVVKPSDYRLQSAPPAWARPLPNPQGPLPNPPPRVPPAPASKP